MAGNLTTSGYSYDAENRVKAANGVTYTYDGEGERVAKSNGKMYWGAGPLAESDGSGNLTEEYIFFNGRRIVRRDVASGAVHYYFSDHLGSSNVVTNSSGGIEEESDFYPFGGERVISDTGMANNFKFTGKERDSESGLDYFGARYYSSAMGRFLTPDWSATPVAVPYAILANPQTLNLYSYVENNPMTGTDPDGHLMFSDAGGMSNGPDGFSGQIESPIMPVLGNSKALGPDRACRYCDEQPASNSEEPKKKKDQNQPDTQKVGNIVHNETGGLRSETKEGSGSSQDLHNAKVAISDVIGNRENAGNYGGVASDKVSPNERNTSQYKDAQQAAAEAARSSDLTGGSKHFYLDYGQKAPTWAAGKRTTTYGPFKNAAGGGDVPKGANVKIIIVHPEDQK